MGNGQLRLALFDPRQTRQFDLRTGSGLDVNLIQSLRPEIAAGNRLQHHTVLAGLGVNGGNLALTEGVVERIGDVRHADTEAAGSVTVDQQIDLQTLVLQIAGDIGQFCTFTQGLRQLAAPLGQQIGVRRRQTELILGTADPIFDGQVLHWLHEQTDA